MTSGLPDDSREADERQAERALHDLRGRVKATRAFVAQHPGMADALRADWRRASWFYARWGITVEQFCGGVSIWGASSRLSLQMGFYDAA
ncbi:MAG TPA: hypothetical protein VFG07_04375 [Thermoplasmata archaeon]|nr:hypothetical protein [Thermoplasmata archaeon]